MSFLLHIVVGTIYLVGPSTNDLVQHLSHIPTVIHLLSAQNAISKSQKDDKIILLSNSNSTTRTSIPDNFYSDQKTIGFHSYIEFPDLGFPTQKLSWKQRIVITTSELLVKEGKMDSLSILQLQSPTAIDLCQGQKCNATNLTACTTACQSSILSFAQIAGVDRAAYGVKDNERIPLLYRNGSNQLIATSQLSNMIQGRSAPQESWRKLWSFILGIEIPIWQADVRPTYPSSTSILTTNATIQAILRSTTWISTGSTLMISQHVKDINTTTYKCCQANNGNQECVLKQCTLHEICPAPYAPSSVTNITCLQEGWSSIIAISGAQHLMPLFIRTDGNAEAAMALASTAVLLIDSMNNTLINTRWRTEASALLDYMFHWSSSQSFVNSTAIEPTHGIVWWNQMNAETASNGVAQYHPYDYGSNTGCILMSATATAGLLQTSSWRERMLYALFAEIRTTGRQGFRPSAISRTDLLKNGWQFYFNDQTTVDGSRYSPHYGAQAASYFLFAGHSTGLKNLFTLPALKYIHGTMEGLKNGKWTWTQSMTNELSMMLLTLAWLVRVDPSVHNIQVLNTVASKLLLHQQLNGGIKQFFGTGNEKNKCNACVPSSNQAYGDGEAPLMFFGNESITDCLYSLNFIAIGLREAFGATGNITYQNAETNLVEYLTKIQVSSLKHPELDGSWFRAFEYDRWEYFASDSDWGYGPWVTDDGWTNGWISTSLALRHGNVTLWDVMKKESVDWDEDMVNRICREMLMEESDVYCVKE